ncbi:MAG: DUF5808 domain-containing protein [Clostridium sp.]
MGSDFMTEKYAVMIVGTIVILTMVILYYFINSVSTKGVFYGVRIPFEFLKNKQLEKIEIDFRKKVKYSGVILIIVNLVLLYMQNDEISLSAALTVMMFITIGYYGYLYAKTYKRVKELKVENNWTREKRGVVVVDTTIRKPSKNDKSKPLNWKWFIVLLIIPIATILFTALSYDVIPNEIGINFSNGIAGKIVEKGTQDGFIALAIMPLTQVAMIIFLCILYIFTINGKVDLKSGNAKLAVERKKKMRLITSKFIFVTTVITLLSLSVAQISIIYKIDENILGLVIMLIMMITGVSFITIYIKSKKELESKDEEDELYKDDDECWKWGMFYYNPNDPSAMIEKRSGVGYTLNFANKWAVIGFVVLLLLIMSISLIPTLF